MITVTHGNVIKENAEALVNTVNCDGFMGKGVALQFKMAYPDNFHYYQKSCKAGEVEPGRMLVFKTNGISNPKFIVNFPTKVHWRQNSRYEYIENGLKDLIKVIKENSIRSIAIPPLGCGQGNLEWEKVRPLIISALSDIPNVDVTIFEPVGTPAPCDMPIHTPHPKMTMARALLIKLTKQYLQLGYNLTLLEVQKIPYFMQESGTPLHLNYKKAYYGPYAPNLSKLLEIMEGHYFSGYSGNQNPNVKMCLIDGASKEADEYLSQHHEFDKNLDRVTSLIQGFETPYGMELLSSIHWLANHDSLQVKNYEEAIEGMAKWSPRKKRMFKPNHIKIAWERLVSEGWINQN